MTNNATFLGKISRIGGGTCPHCGTATRLHMVNERYCAAYQVDEIASMEAARIERLATLEELSLEVGQLHIRIAAAEAAILHQAKLIIARTEELVRLKEAVSPHKQNVDLDYYIGVAQRMRKRELRIVPMSEKE